MVEEIQPTPPLEALDVPPANAFDFASFMSTAVDVAKTKGVLNAAGRVTTASEPGWLLKELIAFIAANGELFTAGFASLLAIFRPLLEQLVRSAGTMMAPGMDILGNLTNIYVGQFVNQQTGISRGHEDPHPGGMKPAAVGLFDTILAPLAGLYGARNPKAAGAGQVNSQFALGSIISLHLSTWMVNIISNLTGLGALKWINSFDDVITGSLNSRSLGRIAMKPYLMKFMADPLERDLNQALPLKVGSPSNLLKGYIRGAISRDELVSKMRGLGFDEAVTEDLLLDTARLFPIDAVAYLVNTEKWTEDQGVSHLKMMGYPEDIAPVVLQLERTSFERAQMRSLASQLVTARGDRLLDNETLRHLLRQLDFTQDEINVLALRGATIAELPKRLTFAQLNAAYRAGVVDLNRINVWLIEEGYAPEDADVIVLTEFTEKADRDAVKARIAGARRVAAEEKAARAAARAAEIQAELAEISGP